MSSDNTIIGKCRKGNDTFELLLYPEPAYSYIEGKKRDLNNILVVEEVFKDAKKGERHGPEAVKKAFGSNDIFAVLKEVLEHGEVQLTTERRRRMVEEKRSAIVNMIHTLTIDPRTGAPHTVLRIENAMEEAKVQIDPFKSPESQLNSILDKLREKIPLKMEVTVFALKVPAEHAYRCYKTIKNSGPKKEEWAKDGSLIALFEMPSGMVSDFLEKINSMAAGSIESKIIEKR